MQGNPTENCVRPKTNPIQKVKYSKKIILDAAKKKKVTPRPLLTKLSGQGKWSRKQQTVYIRFLSDNFETMSRKDLRKIKRIFIKMSKKLKTRVPGQCRSHHQKMMKLHINLEQIIRFHHEQVFPLSEYYPQAKKVEEKTSDTNSFPLLGLFRYEVKSQIIKIEINASKIQSY